MFVQTTNITSSGSNVKFHAWSKTVMQVININIYLDNAVTSNFRLLHFLFSREANAVVTSTFKQKLCVFLETLDHLWLRKRAWLKCTYKSFICQDVENSTHRDIESIWSFLWVLFFLWLFVKVRKIISPATSFIFSFCKRLPISFLRLIVNFLTENTKHLYFLNRVGT